MNPPIFGIKPTGNKAQQFLHRARMFSKAAFELVDYSNGEQFWPKYTLLTHAIELAFMAFAFYSEENGKPKQKKPQSHDLREWYQVAIRYGLPNDKTILDNIDILHDLHFTHYSRYPQKHSTPIPDAMAIAESTTEHLISTFTQSINPR